MIKGIGIDIVEVARIRTLYEKQGKLFVNKIFTEKEIKTSLSKKEPWVFLSARFAAKEAVFKAFGTGMAKGMTFKDVELINRKDGKPAVNLYGRAKEFADKEGISTVFVSVSHENEYAVASIIMEG